MSVLDMAELAAMILGAAFLLFFPFELWRLWTSGRLTWTAGKEMLANLSPLPPALAVNGVVISFATALFVAADRITPWAWPMTWGSLAPCLLLVDLLYYLDHRCGHRVRAYWAVSHSVHHSSPLYNQTTGARISFVDGFISIWFYLPAVFAGFAPALVAACFGLIIAYQQWLHTEAVGRLGWFDRIFNSPSNHRVHHGVEDAYIDKNYGAILIIWDRLFGTYASEAAAPTYGLTRPIASVNPMVVHFAEVAALWRDLVAAPNWRTRLRHLFGPPGASALNSTQ